MPALSDVPAELVGRPTLYLIDGHALIYRAFFAMISRPLTTASGENTSAPYGLSRFLMRLLEERSPDYIGVVLDAGDSFRGELFEEYKGTREKMPDELAASLPRCREIVRAFRIPVIEIDGWEADDVIGTLAVQAAERGLCTVIVSGDKDFYQLIDERTCLLNPGRGGPAGIGEEWVTSANAAERLGVPPERVTDYLALIGDSSDNVPGVRGIGGKTAPKLIEQLGTLEEILARRDEITSARVRRALEEHAEEAQLSKKLVTIRRDAPVALDLESLRRESPDRKRLRELFIELEFHSLVRGCGPEEDGGRRSAPENGYALIAREDDLRRAIAEARRSERVAVAVEGDSPDPMRARVVGLALAAESGRAWYMPFAHRRPATNLDETDDPSLALAGEAPANLPSIDSPPLSSLRELLADPHLAKSGHDIKYDLVVLGRAGVSLDGIAFDTSIASYCLDPGKRGHGLELLALERFDRRLPTRDEVCGSGRSRIPYAEVPPERAVRYAAVRADYTLRLTGLLERELEQHAMRKLLDEVEMPLVPVLAAMERAGIRIDLAFFESLAARMAREIELVEQEIQKLAGGEVNLRSVPQLRELLFDRLGLPVVRRTKTGPSTDESVLTTLAMQGHEVPRLILEHRELDKLNSTYVMKLPAMVNPGTGRLHTRFNQTVTATGRLSSSDPNLQNIPVRSALGREIRRGFVPEEGWVFLSADYSQIELRVLAHLSGDPSFVKAFREGRDIHRDTAALIFGVEPEAVTPGMRDQAKTINFATIYGQGPVALAGQLRISRAEAQTFIQQYFDRFSGVRDYLERMKEEAREKGYVETLLGRRRYIPEIRSPNPGMRGFGERTATNSPIQGTAADLIKVAMIRLHRRLAGTRCRMLLQVHDELLFEVPESDVRELRASVREEMEGAIEMDVPLRVDCAVGKSWYDCKER
ncbi:MAG: DNA polymerase I [Gemmatimonadota bacterium]